MCLTLLLNEANLHCNHRSPATDSTQLGCQQGIPPPVTSFTQQKLKTGFPTWSTFLYLENVGGLLVVKEGELCVKTGLIQAKLKISAASRFRFTPLLPSTLQNNSFLHVRYGELLGSWERVRSHNYLRKFKGSMCCSRD